MSTVASSPVNKSRWGYHPVSYQEFQAIKEAHKVFLKALQDGLRRYRWERKDPDNRKGPKPELSDNWYKLLDVADDCFAFKRFYLKFLVYHQNCRKPRPTPEEVQFLQPPTYLGKSWQEVLKLLQS